MKVNLGCGDFYADGWVNVDQLGCPHPVDECVDIREPLPFTGVTHAYAGHVLEHLDLAEAAGLLSNLASCMADGGQLMIVGPDVERAQWQLDHGELGEEEYQLIRYGGHRWPGDEHRWGCEPYQLMKLLYWTERWTDVQEVPIALVPEPWPVVSRITWQCAVSATVLPQEASHGAQ